MEACTSGSTRSSEARFSKVSGSSSVSFGKDPRQSWPIFLGTSTKIIAVTQNLLAVTHQPLVCPRQDQLLVFSIAKIDIMAELSRQLNRL